MKFWWNPVFDEIHSAFPVNISSDSVSREGAHHIHTRHSSQLLFLELWRLWSHPYPAASDGITSSSTWREIWTHPSSHHSSQYPFDFASENNHRRQWCILLRQQCSQLEECGTAHLTKWFSLIGSSVVTARFCSSVHGIFIKNHPKSVLLVVINCNFAEKNNLFGWVSIRKKL